MLPTQLPNRNAENRWGLPADWIETNTNQRLTTTGATTAAFRTALVKPPRSSNPITLNGTPKRTNGRARRVDNSGCWPPSQNPTSREGTSSSRKLSMAKPPLQTQR